MNYSYDVSSRGRFLYFLDSGHKVLRPGVDSTLCSLKTYPKPDKGVDYPIILHFNPVEVCMMPAPPSVRPQYAIAASMELCGLLRHAFWGGLLLLGKSANRKLIPHVHIHCHIHCYLYHFHCRGTFQKGLWPF